MSKQEVIICQNFTSELQQKISAHSYDKIFVLTDEHTSRFCLPLLQDISSLKKQNKLSSVQKTSIRIWKHWLMYGTSSAAGVPHAIRY